MADNSKVILFDLSQLLLARLPTYLAEKLREWIDCSLLSPDNDQFYALLRGEGWGDVRAVVIFGHRIPDICLAIIAKMKGKKVFYVQHGLFKERLERDWWTIWPLLRLKGAYYARSYFSARAYAPDTVSIGVLFDLLRASVFSNKRLKNVLLQTKTNIDVAYVYDSIQDFSYREMLGEAIKQVVSVGVLDAGRLSPASPKKNTALILCQSLVEDGRMREAHFTKQMVAAITVLEADGWDVALFMHQRGDTAMYDRMGLGDKVIRSNWIVPSAELYLTDYSTLILEPLNQGRSTARLNVSGHEPMDELKRIPVYPEKLMLQMKNVPTSPFEKIAQDIYTSL